MKYAYYFWFLILLNYSITTHGKSNARAPSSNFSPTVFGETKFATRRNKALAAVGAYCKSTYSAKDAEELLAFGK